MADCGHALCLPRDSCRFVVRTQAERDADGTTWRAAAHPWQEYNAHGNTCHYPGCTMTEEEHRELTRDEVETLGRYNAETSRGVAHTPEYAARMAELQRRFDIGHGLDADIWMTTEPIAPPRRRWWHRYTRRNP